MENDEFYQTGTSNGANADLMHLSPVISSAGKKKVDPLMECSPITELVNERSKESTDMQMPSHCQLEYSRSMNQIEADATPFGADEEEEKHGDSKLG